MDLKNAPDIVDWLLNTWPGYFEWDSGNIQKLEKHGFTQLDVEWALCNKVIFGGEIQGDFSERRFLIFARTQDGRYLTVVWTIRQNTIRAISCRRSRDNEKKKYTSSI